MKRYVCLLGFMLASCSGEDPETGMTEDEKYEAAATNLERQADDTERAANQALSDAAAAIREADGAMAKAKSNWDVSSREDEMRGTAIHRASVRSENSFSLGWPYGTVRLTMELRRHPEWGNDVIFMMDEGQFVCSSYDGCLGNISIDGDTERLTLNEPSDHSSNVLFARYGDSMMRKIKASERVIVELPVYQNGNLQFKFDTGSFEWQSRN